MNGSLDAVGCAYGRETRKILEGFRQEYVEKTARTEERLRYGSERFEEFDEAIRGIRMEMRGIQQRLYWLLGAYTIGGTLIGNILFWMVQHLLGG